MADPNQSANGAAPVEPSQSPEPPAKSLREIAEASWDEVVEDSGADDGAAAPQAPSGQEGRPRDTLGRFVPADQAAKPGEAEPPPDGTQPRPEDVSAPQQPTPPHPAPEGSSSEAPANWSAQDRQTFAALPPEGQAFLLRRHSEMEGDYQRRVQATATAAQFTAALAPVFNDPVIAESLKQTGLSPYDAITEWASFHRRFYTEPVGLIQELMQRARLDPAAFGHMSQSGPGALSEADLKDPAIRFFAENIGKTFNDVQTLRNELHQMRQADAERQNAEVLRVTRWSIDSFADEKDQQGNLLHPHFDAVMPQIQELFRANPGRDLKEAYETAIWMVPSVRSGLLTAAQSAQQKEQATQRARQAVRSNVRGVTSPVSKPSGENGPKGLRETIEATADELGI